MCHGTNPDPRSYLNTCKENDLSAFLVEVAKAGHGKSRQQVKALATKAVRDKATIATATAVCKKGQQAKAPVKIAFNGKCLLDSNKGVSNGWSTDS